MKMRPTELILPTLVALTGAVLVCAWLQVQPPTDLVVRVPGLDSPGDQSTVAREQAVPVVAGEPVLGGGQPAQVAGQWPCFRNTLRDGISSESVKLSRSWPTSGPAVLWSLTLGEGYASPAIADGRVFVLDYDEPAQADTLRCLSLADGREVWHNSYPVVLTRNHGISRTVPALIEDLVITLGPRLHLGCWDARSGQCLWLKDLVTEFSATVPRWYAGQCPLIDQGRLIIAPGGRALLAALECRTGKVVWESPNPRGWKMTHASVVPMEVAGRRQYVYCGTGGVAGIAADDGALLWDSTDWPETFATSPSPVVLPADRLFLCSGYHNTMGSLLLQVNSSAGGWSAETLQRLTPKQFNCEQQTPILYQGYLYGTRKRGGGQLVCLDVQGNELWNSGGDRFGHGPFLIADGLIYVLDNDGLLTMAEATSEGYRRLGQHQVFENGHDAWGPLAIAGGRLILRDLTRMTCLDVKAK